MELNHVRRGNGSPLLLIHGLGSSHRSWAPVLAELTAEREVIAIDLPGFGDSPPLETAPSIAALADAVESFIGSQALGAVDVAGSSMGARLVLELARRGHGGAAVALAPGGFWTPGELRYFQVTVGASIKLIRALQPAMPKLTASTAGRTLLFAQFSARPWRLSSDVTLTEMRSFAGATALDSTLHELTHGPLQAGAAHTPGAVTIGWGRQDRVLRPAQAVRAQSAFPQARLHWFDRCGHFPQWDAPQAATRLILSATG